MKTNKPKETNTQQLENMNAERPSLSHSRPHRCKSKYIQTHREFRIPNIFGQRVPGVDPCLGLQVTGRPFFVLPALVSLSFLAFLGSGSVTYPLNCSIRFLTYDRQASKEASKSLPTLLTYAVVTPLLVFGQWLSFPTIVHMCFSLTTDFKTRMASGVPEFGCTFTLCAATLHLAFPKISFCFQSSCISFGSFVRAAVRLVKDQLVSASTAALLLKP